MEQLYDVIIFEKATGVIDTIVGKQMKLDSGFHNANKRLDTVLDRLNEEDFDAAIVETGKYNKGDIYQ